MSVNKPLDSDSLLVDAVERRTAIWKKTDPNHCNTFILANDWGDVAKEVGIGKRTAQNRWKKLANHFHKVHASIPKDRSGAAANNFVPDWPLYQSMKFLLDDKRLFASTGNLGLRRTRRNVRTPAYHLGEEIDDEEEDDLYVDEEMEHEVRMQDPDGKKKRGKTEWRDTLMDLEKKKLDALITATKGQKTGGDNGDTMFLNSLLPFLAQLTGEKKLRCRCEIQDVVMRYAYDTSTWQPKTAVEELNNDAKMSTAPSRPTPNDFAVRRGNHARDDFRGSQRDRYEPRTVPNTAVYEPANTSNTAPMGMNLEKPEIKLEPAGTLQNFYRQKTKNSRQPTLGQPTPKKLRSQQDEEAKQKFGYHSYPVPPAGHPRDNRYYRDLETTQHQTEAEYSNSRHSYYSNSPLKNIDFNRISFGDQYYGDAAIDPDYDPLYYD